MNENLSWLMRSLSTFLGQSSASNGPKVAMLLKITITHLTTSLFLFNLFLTIKLNVRGMRGRFRENNAAKLAFHAVTLRRQRRHLLLFRGRRCCGVQSRWFRRSCGRRSGRGCFVLVGGFGFKPLLRLCCDVVDFPLFNLTWKYRFFNNL